MNLRDLCRHQEWADATIWRAVLAEPLAAGDNRTRDLLFHEQLGSGTHFLPSYSQFLNNCLKSACLTPTPKAPVRFRVDSDRQDCLSYNRIEFSTAAEPPFGGAQGRLRLARDLVS